MSVCGTRVHLEILQPGIISHRVNSAMNSHPETKDHRLERGEAELRIDCDTTQAQHFKQAIKKIDVNTKI